MMSVDDPDTEELLRRAGDGDRDALDRLLDRYRGRLRRMVATRMDPRLAPRVDASDVVQEALMEAAGRLLRYIEERPAPFYVWLRGLAWQRLVDLSRRHLHTQRRGVGREAAWSVPLPDESAMELADRLVSPGTSPSVQTQRNELRDSVRAALAQLSPSDREVLVLRHLEQLLTHEVAAVLEIAEPTVRYRLRRALERLGELLGGAVGKDLER